MQNYFGELIALVVAVSWSLTALFFEFAGNRVGSLTVNLLRLFFALFLLGALLYFTTGSFWPLYADSKSWLWISLSGFVGFVFGDFCLFYSYTLITARFSQLLMTLAPPFAAFFGWLMLDERLSIMGFVGMVVTLTGIAISIFKRENRDNSERRGSVKTFSNRFQLGLPIKGVLFGVGGALGQGLGIVLSKIGMNYYAVSAHGTEVASYIPFASTQIRIITGVIGFALVILLTKRSKLFISGFKDKRAIAAIFMGAIFGPFVGVSLSLMAVQHANTAVASTIMATTPIIILLPYVLFYKKKVSPMEVLGAIISVIGVSLFFVNLP